MTRYLTPLAVLILILTLASLGASPAYANHSAPTGLSVTGKTTNSVSLDWNDYPRDPSVIRQSRVRVYNSAGTLLSTRLTGSKTSAYTATGLSPSTGYRFAVAVQFSGDHVSNYSSRVRATTDAVAVTCPDGQYKAEYFANETLSGSPGITRCEASVNNTWADGQSPGTGIPHDDFSARYTGRIGFAGGDYEFKVTVDDGARLYVDGELVIDKWFQQAPTTYAAKRTLAAGFHDIKVEYYDTHLSGTIRLEITNFTTPDPPSSVVYVAPTEGAQVSGVTPVRVRAPAGTDWIGVYANCMPGGTIGEDLAPEADGTWTVQWDTRECANGEQTIDTWAFRDDGSNLGNTNRMVNVSNTGEPPPYPDPVACEPVAAPSPIAGQGYAETFSDCFDTLDRSVWSNRSWWESPSPVGSQVVENGELRLRRERSTGFANTTMSTEPLDNKANPKSFKYGYFEARMRYETVQGNGPAFWLFSTRHATNPEWPDINPLCAPGGQFPKAECLSAELDIFEGYGRVGYGGSRQDDFYTGTIHRNSSGHYGEANQSRFVQHGCRCDFSQYHVFGVKWTPTEVSYYLDGQLQGRLQPFDSFNQPMHIYLYNWTTGWATENVPNTSTQNELDVFVDWVRVWQQ